MIVTIVGRVAVDAGSADNERHESVRQRRVVPTPRRWRQCTWRQQPSGRDGGKRAVLRGDHVISRKAIAQGMSDVLRCPVCSCAHSLCTLRMRPRVQRASGIPCALWIGEGEEISSKARALIAARSRKCAYPSFRGAAKRRATMRNCASENPSGGKVSGKMDSGPAPSGASRNDEDGLLRRLRSSQ
jgi:hypothetical protein